MTSRLLTATEAADLLNVRATWLLARARADQVPHKRLGRYVRFVEADLLAWLDTDCHHGPRNTDTTPTLRSVA